MNNGIQDFLREAGEAGCYALCLISVAEEYLHTALDASESLLLGVNIDAVYYNEADFNDSNNFYVSNPERFLEAMTNADWSVRRETADYVPLFNEFVINRWERIKTGAVVSHFDRTNFHPLKHSLTIERGKIVSKRICRIAG